MKCKDCKFWDGHIPKHAGETGYSDCGLLKFREDKYCLIVDVKTDYCSFGQAKEVEQ